MMEMTRHLVSDLAELEDLSEVSINASLQARFERDLIYTSVRDILIAINPCRPLPIYDEEIHQRYMVSPDESVQPHVFQVANAAYKRMQETQTNQVIIVAGESGAGKTESTKYMLRHLVYISEGGQRQLQEKIVQINPLLESFGNAKTVKNSNSSRYAKYLEIRFQESGHMAGAVVRDYMLEKSRVVHQGKGEANFHIFYQMFAGCARDKLDQMYLTKEAQTYRVMASNSDYQANKTQYAAMFKTTIDTLKQINVDPEIILSMLAAVVNITEIRFEENDKGVAMIASGADPFEPFDNAARLLDLNHTKFGEALIASIRVFQGQDIATYKSVDQANDGRDALAKMLYERMFGWLVRQVNIALQSNSDMTTHLADIGILDIAGFEKLQDNSLEQLCINLVNEKLQNFMNETIFTMEVQIYRDEGVQLDGIEFKNNDDILDMFHKKRVGLLDILDEVSLFQQGSDIALVQRFKQTFSNNGIFLEPRGDRPEFIIQHFAGLVNYNAVGFIEKNRDRLNEELKNCMKHSLDEFISDLFTVRRGPTGTISATKYNYHASRRQGVAVMPVGSAHLRPTPKGKDLADELGRSLKKKFGAVRPPEKGITTISAKSDDGTLISYFKKSLIDLLEKLKTCEQFYVRCIKPNEQLSPGDYDTEKVADQLRYNGLAQVAIIRKMGYAVRKDYSDFLRRYCDLLPAGRRATGSDIEKTKALLMQLPAEHHRNFRCGKTKVFLTDDVNIWLEKWRHIYMRGQDNAARRVTQAVRRLALIKAEEKRTFEEKKGQDEEQKQDGGTDAPNGSRVPRQPSPTPATHPEPPRNTLGSTTGGLGDTWAKPRYEPRPPSPPRHRPGSTAELEQEKDRQEKKEKLAYWDVCQLLSRDRKTRDVHEERYLQVIKVITYIFLFCVIVWCTVCQKLSLVILTSSVYDRTQNRTQSEKVDDSKEAAARHILLTLAILIPYLLTFITSMFKWMFGNFPFPRISTLIMCFLAETMHSVGLCGLCFVILPETDIVRGIMILNGVSIVPSLALTFCASETERYNKDGSVRVRSAKNKVYDLVLDCLSVIIQCGFIPFVLVREYFLPESEVSNERSQIAMVVVAMIFISFSWWENFVDDRFLGTLSPKGSWHKLIMSSKFDLQQARPVVGFFMSLWKIVMTVILSWLIKDYLDTNTNDHQRDIANEHFGDIFDYLGRQALKMNTSILTLTLAAFVGHYFCQTACKLKLQRFSFNLPLLLSTPIAVGIAVWECESSTDDRPLNVFTDEHRVCYMGDEKHTWYIYVAGTFIWVSLYWIGRHIFFPDIERLAKAERLFLNPFYCGILFEEHMVLNRRRHNRRVHRVIKDGKETFRLSSKNATVDVNGQEKEEKRRENSEDSGDEDVRSDTYIHPNYRQNVPMIYACATMWHENKQEMVQLMKSIFRMDRDQFLRREAEQITGKADKEFYDFEAHIFFDDCMEETDDGEFVPNQFVRLLMSVIDLAASSIYGRQMQLRPAVKVPSPYGGQLILTLPGHNFLFVHLKDKNKIRHRKRWSQVMYMYYLLGFRIVRMCSQTVENAMKSGHINHLVDWGSNVPEDGISRSHIFQVFDEQVIKKADNTFILALDGDVDFSPGAVKLLLDRMRKSDKVGAACGRIHPIGTGPVVWFQKFEYAIAHWLQKATEHVLGCVLCSPGCFSMFRGSALMDDNIMRKYTIVPTEAAHHLMYDQGEDRWLCTLLLQQGYRVDYAAGSDAFTYAPEGFAEFFNQRRRWMPSTVANIVDLLSDYKNTVYVNSNISMLYIFYQGALLVSTIVGPATVLMMIAGANLVVFGVNLWYSYLIALLPAFFYFGLCFFVKPKWQIMVAEIMTGFYAFIMMIVLVGTIVQAAKESPFHPSVIFLAVLFFMFMFSAILHPKEWSCVIFGALYFLLVPTGFLLLIFYSLVNLHVVSWGTREVPKRKTPEEEAEEKLKAEEKKKKKEQGFFGRFLPQSPLKDVKEIVSKLLESKSDVSRVQDPESTKLLKEISEGIKMLVENQNKTHDKSNVSFQSEPELLQKTREPVVTGGKMKPKSILRSTHEKKGHVGISDSVKVLDTDTEEVIYDKVPKKRDELMNPAWTECKSLGNGPIIQLLGEELEFWKSFIDKYLSPLELTEKQKKDTQASLIDLRNNVCLGMAMINLLWIAINFMFQLTSPTKIPISLKAITAEEEDLEENLSTDELDSETADNRVSVDLLGLMFIIFYLVILILQFFGMLIHRWGTFLHLVSVTKLRNPFHKIQSLRNRNRRNDKPDDPTNDEAIKIVEHIMEAPAPDYPSDTDSDDEEEREIREEIKNLQTTGTRIKAADGNLIGASTRQIDLSRRASRADNLRAENRMSKSLLRTSRIIKDGQRMDNWTRTPDLEQLQHNFQQDYRRGRDNRYRHRQLPPVSERQKRLNLGPGRSALSQKLNLSRFGRRDQETDDSRPLIDEHDSDSDSSGIYDLIKPPKGTLGRQFGRNMKTMMKAVRFEDERRSQSNRRSNNHSSQGYRLNGRSGDSYHVNETAFLH